MSDYDNTNSGAIFKNDRKQNDRQPDMTGSINVAGVDYYISAWTKQSGQGKKFLSLAVTAKDEPKQAPVKQVEDIDFDADDLPF